MKKIFIPALTLLMLTSATIGFSQSRDERKVTDFSAVDASGSFDIYLKKGNEEKVVIEAQSGPIEKITTEVQGATLKIYLQDQRNNYNFRNVNIYVTFKHLEEVIGSGSGSIRLESPLKAETIKIVSSGSGSFYTAQSLEASGDVKINNSGSGSMKMQSSISSGSKVNLVNSGSGGVTIDELHANDLSINNSGSGSMKINGGKTRGQSIVLSGSGSLYSQDLESVTCNVRKSGSGSVYVNAREELNGSSSGSGNVYLKGSATKLDFSSSGSGKIKTIN